jgi:hypothetical protein
LNLEDRLSRETSGLISGRDDCNGVLGIHTPRCRGIAGTIPRQRVTKAIADTHLGTTEVPCRCKPVTRKMAEEMLISELTKRRASKL